MITDPMGNVAIQTWFAPGKLKDRFDSSGHAIHNTYNPETGMLTGSQDAQGNSTSYQFDKTGRPTDVTRPDGSHTTFDYTDEPPSIETSGTWAHKTVRTDTIGNSSVGTISFTDANGRPFSENSPTGLTLYKYDSSGQLKSINVNGQVTSYDYDGLGRRISQTAAGQITRYTYQNDVDEESGQTYDDVILPDDTSGDDADNSRQRTIHDAAGRVIASMMIDPTQTDPNLRQRRTDYTPDGAGRATTVDPPGSGADSSSSTYDAAGRITKSTDEFGRDTLYTYDGNGQLIQTKYPDDSLSQTVYDSLGQVLFSNDRHRPSDPAPGTRNFYDANGQLVRGDRLSAVKIEIFDDAEKHCKDSRVLNVEDAIILSTSET
ncbi:MAG: hypothetical protein DME26_20510, partial [Verrucomicrobia bacterium]